MEQLRAAQRRQASRAWHQQHSGDQGSRQLASDEHHGAGRVGHCPAAQGISAVAEASLRERTRSSATMDTAYPIGFTGPLRKWSPKALSRRITESCGIGTIIVRIMK